MQTSYLDTLDQLTGGVFQAQTSAQRLERIQQWLEGNPSIENLQNVYKELVVRDRGAAKCVKEKIDENKSIHLQQMATQDWSEKGQILLGQNRLNIADALAWQRDAAKAGAPLSKEPLLGMKQQILDRVKAIEDLTHRSEVQREAAVLIAQRLEILSTKSIIEAKSAQATLSEDVQTWLNQAKTIAQDAQWPSIELKYMPLLQSSEKQLLLVWQAFDQALREAQLADESVQAPLPSVVVWADEIRVKRANLNLEQSELHTPKAREASLDPKLKEQAQEQVTKLLKVLEDELTLGHGKASNLAAVQLRNALKEWGRLIDTKLDAQVHAALSQAGELGDWQRWRADQLREDLVVKAQELLNRPKGQELGGRKMQDNLRQLREQWKQTDQGGVPNHTLWKRFDEACNEAYKVVHAWLEQMKEESNRNQEARMGLIAEINAWTEKNTNQTPNWREQQRDLHQFEKKWKTGGHVNEKVFAEIEPLYKQAMQQAQAPLLSAQNDNIAQRQILIEKAKALAAEDALRVDDVKLIQQQWQQLALQVPIERKHEQKLWDEFRKPLDQAFEKKHAAKAQQTQALNAYEQQVFDAVKVLRQAIEEKSIQKIEIAKQSLHNLLQGQVQTKDEQVVTEEIKPETTPSMDGTQAENPQVADENAKEAEEIPSATKAVPVRKPVVAVRGDDRSVTQKIGGSRIGGDRNTKSFQDKGGKKGDTKNQNTLDTRRALQRPRLSDAAFRAQRQALEAADLLIKKLAIQTHVSTLEQLLQAWELRNVEHLQAQMQNLGKRATAAMRLQWSDALQVDALAHDQAWQQALLRLEIAAQVPTPDQHMAERRVLQLQLLTKRQAVDPEKTWVQDVALVLKGQACPEGKNRLLAVLRALMR